MTGPCSGSGSESHCARQSRVSLGQSGQRRRAGLRGSAMGLADDGRERMGGKKTRKGMTAET
jgi:hypothetical protein